MENETKPSPPKDVKKAQFSSFQALIQKSKTQLKENYDHLIQKSHFALRTTISEKDFDHISECKRYAYNMEEPTYLYDIKCVEFLTSIKKDNLLYKTLAHFNSRVIDKMNEISSPNIKYRSYKTPKYVIICCTKCKNFKFWFKNNENWTMDELKEQDTDVLDLVFFRSII